MNLCQLVSEIGGGILVGEVPLLCMYTGKK